MRDRRLVYAAAFLRALATGMIGVLLGVHLVGLGYSPRAIGGVVAAGLAGGAAAALLVTLLADRRGRRRFLVELALLAAAGGLGLLAVTTPAAVGFVACVGMVNGMGRDRGAALVLEQAVLPATVAVAERTRAFAWYNVLQDVGHALGGVLAGATALARPMLGLDAAGALRAGIVLYAVLMLAGAVIYLGLSPRIEEPAAARQGLSPETRRVLAKLSVLFALDSLGGGFLTTALVAVFFQARFGVGVATIGLLFGAARVANAVSHLAAAWLARRIGLVETMVFTHLPSSLLLVSVAVAPSFPVAALLFLLREGLTEMDVPTRQSYVMAVVAPAERTAASGITHLVRLGGWAVAPAVAGAIMEQSALAAPLVAGAALKIAYDLLLFAAFRHLRPPEERRG